MTDKKPKFWVTHDQDGVKQWQSKTRPVFDKEKNKYVCPEGVPMRLPYSYFGHMLREGAMVGIDIEAAVLEKAGKKHK